MSDEDRGPSPADGPAKVFGREWTPLAHNPSYLELDIAWMRLTRWDGSWTFGDIASDDGSASSDCSLIEGRLLQLFSAIASLAPSSRLVAALDGETRTALVRELTRECSWENLIAERDEALARAESLERQFLHLVRCEREANERGDAERSRAEQAERERDAMHAAAEELRAQGAALGEDECEAKAWRGDRFKMRVVPDGLELTQVTGITKGWSATFYPATLKHAADEYSDPNGWPRALAYFDAHRHLLPDECRERGKPPRKMREDEVRGPNRGSDGAVLTEADSAESPKDQTLGSVSPSGECPKCNGTGRSCGNGRCDYQWCASCKACNGTGRKTEESDGPTRQSDALAQMEIGNAVRTSAFRHDVPQSLFLAARRWMGWEPTLTPVDLTELREAWKTWLGSHNSHDWLRFSNAIEKLLSGGAP